MPNIHNETNWICYYITDVHGNGRDTPNYLHYSGTNEEQCKDFIVMVHEPWAIFAETYDLRVEFGVIPPHRCVDEAIAEIEETKAQIDANLEALKRFRENTYGTFC
jgi:hypothetical protein